MSAAVRAVARSSMAEIVEFLEQKRFAAVGLSRNPKDFTRTLVREFVRRGYDVVPVNPTVSEMDGRQCFANVSEVRPPVSAALLLTSAAVTADVARQCVEAGVTHVWFYRGGGNGAVTPEAVEFCREHGLKVVAGECPYMFLPGAGFPHRVHRLIRKITKTYPR